MKKINNNMKLRYSKYYKINNIGIKEYKNKKIKFISEKDIIK